MFSFKFTVMKMSDLQNKIFRFKISLKTFENFKTTLGYDFLTFVSLFHFRPMSPFLSQGIELWKRKLDFLSKNIEKHFYILGGRLTNSVDFTSQI